MKISGKKMGSVKAVKDSLKKGGSSLNTYIKNVPADGITVRFLTEPEEWFGFYEYWNDESRNFTPMAVGEVLPDGTRPSFRYLASAVDVETDRVIPLKMAKTMANSLMLKYDKYGTMLDRNYELQRHGEGLDTTYDVTPDAPSKLNLAKYETLDLEKVLIDARSVSLGETDTEKSAPTVDDDEVDDEDDAFSVKATRAKKAESAKKKAVVVDEDDDEDTEDEDEDEMEEMEELEDDEESEVLDEETLSAMSLRDLRVICEDMDIDHDGMSKPDMVEAIIEAQEQ